MARGVAVVTGGSAGLGRAIVRELAVRGWDVAVLARGQDGVDAAAADVQNTGSRSLAVSVDVTDREALENAATRVEDELGPIDLWVNNAMSGVFAEFMDTDPADFERATAVDYFGFVNGTRAALARMIPRDRGHVIQVGSGLAHRGIPLQAAYCGAKHAIQGFTESVRTELMHEGHHVHISQVDMPALNTRQFDWVKSELPQHPQPLPPIFEPEVGARAVADVADRPRPRTWVGESTVIAIMGNRLWGSFWDWYVSKTAYAGQQAPDITAPMLPPNLYEPVPGDHGAHGDFDGRSLAWTPQTWAIGHRRTLAMGTAAAGVAAVVWVAGVAGALSRRRHPRSLRERILRR
ncbi:SDR family oxidoreductase [Microbacterium mangrovi]|uniref:SDR family oxidoreductase n=1 Tax=Microbacterium mangrovi TaxID=1348253 RepID=UPI00068B5BD2|nr:SDR family oxidoreductase [Microbacterium mangrovi]